MKILKIDVVKLLGIIVFCAILVLAVCFKIELLKFLPLLISVFVMFLQSRVNPYAFMLGAINSVIYAVSYARLTLYATALYAILFSFPLQLFTFLNWKKHSQKNVTETKWMSSKVRVAGLVSTAVAWALMYIGFSAFGSTYLVWDNTVSLFGIISTVLCLLRFSEFAIIQFVSGIISCVLFAIMTVDDVQNSVWLIFTVYSQMCIVAAYFKMKKSVKMKETV